METENLQGRRGTYAISARRPFAFGRVSVLYEATAPTGTVVAVKLFKQAPRTADDKPGGSEFFRELEAQTHLSHPNILPILDFGSAGPDHEPFVIYPFCQAGDLRRLMRQRQYMPLHEALPILEQVAAAIDSAHSRGFIHGDVKPENILFMTDASHACLSDFGMARHFAFTAKVSTVVPDSQGGTSSYLSPEELADGKQSPRSDLYSFGLVSYQLLTGRLPFEPSAPLFRQIQAKVEGKLIDPVDANPVVTDSVAQALRRVLSVAPLDRPQSASEFCALLRGQAASQVPQTRDEAGAQRGLWSSLDYVGTRPNLVDFYMTNLTGNPLETCIAASRLILSGFLDRFPALKVVLVHAGGFMPYQIGRLDHGFRVRAETSASISAPPSSYLRRFWYDTITHAGTPLKFLVDMVGIDRVMLGTDLPFDMADVHFRDYFSVAGLDQNVVDVITGANAEELFSLNVHGRLSR